MKKRTKKDIRKKVMAYTAAAGALAMAPLSEAAIVYSGPQNLTVNSSNTLRNIDLNSDAQNDFRFSYSYYSGYSWGVVNILNLYSNQFIQSDGAVGTGNPGYGNSDAAFLPQNYAIGPNLAATFVYWTAGSEPLAGTGYSTQGSFINRTGFLGVRFHSAQCQGANWNYGWIRFSNTGGPNGNIVDWAYENACNTPIPAGATANQQQPATPVPTINEWGMIGMAGLLGAAAVNQLRKRKEEQN